MATRNGFKRTEINSANPAFSTGRSIIETQFYGNNVVRVSSIAEAYRLAAASPGTIVTDMPVERPEEIGLPSDAKMLVFNDGTITGRTAAARRIIGAHGVNAPDIYAKVREAAYNMRYKKLYHAEAFVGLNEDFMVKAHLLVPEGEENLMYNWLANFQPVTPEYEAMYKRSKVFENEGDIFFFADTTWSHPEHPLGLSFFDPAHNVGAVLGLRYFGELKKGTLTLAWGIANRNGFASCHGGQKRYNLSDGRKFVAGVFGLSGSGKSTITHAKHGGKYDVTVLHDDAFVISVNDGSSVALEPAYFDKTQDYPLSSPDNKYMITMQNVAATLDDEGKVVVLTEDLRNGNGRAVKSKLWSPARVDKFAEPVNAVFWLMKDPSMPPVVKIDGSVLSSVLGACLATKRTTAERLAPGVDPDMLVFEPYANPFRTYPLADDYNKFKALFAERNVKCYILNTGFLMDKKVTPSVTLGCLEKIIEGTADFKKWAGFSNLSILDVEGFMPDMKDEKYLALLKARMADRYAFLKSRETELGGFDKLPEEAVSAIEQVIKELE